MKTLGWLLLVLAGGIGFVTVLHVIGRLRVEPPSPELLTTIIPGLILIAVVAVPGVLLIVLNFIKRS